MIISQSTLLLVQRGKKRHANLSREDDSDLVQMAELLPVDAKGAEGMENGVDLGHAELNV